MNITFDEFVKGIRRWALILKDLPEEKPFDANDFVAACFELDL